MNKIIMTILIFIFCINVNYCQNRNVNHGVLIGINQTLQNGLKFRVHDTNGTDRAYSIPNNYEEQYGLKAGYFISYSLNRFVSINLETTIDWSRLRIGYDRTNSIIQSGIIYSKQEGDLNLSDLSINLPVDLHWKFMKDSPFKSFYLISGFNLKILLDNKSEWRYSEQILYDRPNNIPTTFEILPETSENILSDQRNYSLRLGIGFNKIQNRIRIELLSKFESSEYIKSPSFKKQYLELNMKIDLARKQKTE